MKYADKTFTLPVCAKPISDLEYALRVGNITPAEYQQAVEHQPTEGFRTEGSGERSENSSPTA